MRLSYFNSIYQLFAGIAATIVGVNVIKSYLIDYLKSDITKYGTVLQSEIDAQAIYQDILISVIADKKLNSVQAFAIIDQLTTLSKKTKSLQANVSEQNERAVIISKLSALLWMDFLYTCYIMFVAALSDSGYYPVPSTSFALVANTSLMSIFLVLIMLIVRSAYKKSKWGHGICYFLGSIFFAHIIHELDIKGIKTHELGTIWLSLFVCILPFLIAGCRIPFYKVVLRPRIEKEVSSIKTMGISISTALQFQ